MVEQRHTITFIFEYGFESGDSMGRSLAKALERQLHGVRCNSIHGVLKEYRAGGLAPRRLWNLAVVYLRTALHMVAEQPDCVIVRSTPPGIQLWTLAWAQLRQVPVVCWLMDYHPEIEARALDRRGLDWIADWLRLLDAAAMTRFAAIVVLDRAMATMAAERSGAVPIIVHPTWETAGAIARLPVPEDLPRCDPDTRRLVYAGTLASSHDLAVLERVLRKAAAKGMIELHVIGGTAAGCVRFRDIAGSSGATVRFHSRTPKFADLGPLFSRIGADVGLVLLAEDVAGLVSPSKFSSYLAFGLPLLYVGPSGSNSDFICRELAAGFALASSPDDTAVVEASKWIWSARRLRASADRVKVAARHFAAFGAESMASRLIPHLPGALMGNPALAGNAGTVI